MDDNGAQEWPCLRANMKYELMIIKIFDMKYEKVKISDRKNMKYENARIVDVKLSNPQTDYQTVFT